MEKIEALVYFTNELARNGHILFVDNPEAQEYLRKNNFGFFPLSYENKLSALEAIGSSELEVTGSAYLKEGRKGSVSVQPKFNLTDDRFKVIGESDNAFCLQPDPSMPVEDLIHSLALLSATETIRGYAKSVPEANYFFSNKKLISSNWQSVKLSVSAFPYAVIGEADIPLIRELFFGRMVGEAKSAADMLSILNKVEIRWAKLFKEDPGNFCQYFYRSEAWHQKEIIHAIFERGLKNPEIDKWLSEKYPALVTEVGRNRLLGEKNGD